MTSGAMLFMLLSWGFVLGLAGWSFWRILKKPGSRHKLTNEKNRLE